MLPRASNLRMSWVLIVAGLGVSACSNASGEGTAEGDTGISVSSNSAESNASSTTNGDGDGDEGTSDTDPSTTTSSGDGDDTTTTSSGDGDSTTTTSSGDGDGDGDGSSTTTSGMTPPTAPGGYYVEGNEIFDENDQLHIFRGVDRPSLEWNPEGEGLSQSDIGLIAGWNANVVRIALSQGYWLQGSVAYNANYQNQVDQVVQWCLDAGMDVMLDLHWSDKGDLGQWPGQQRMADQNSVTFWQQVADAYKDEGRVFFELYNEPHDVPWGVWLDGGDSGDGFQVAGMQQLYDTVRATGADNLVIVGGLNYAYDLSGVPDHRVEGYNIVYATHPYDFADKQPDAWEGDWGFLSDTDPIFVSEFGSFDCNPWYSQEVINYAEARGLSWSAWAWYPGGCGFPALIEDWQGTPSAVGQVVQTAMQAN